MLASNISSLFYSRIGLYTRPACFTVLYGNPPALIRLVKKSRGWKLLVFRLGWRVPAYFQVTDDISSKMCGCRCWCKGWIARWKREIAARREVIKDRNSQSTDMFLNSLTTKPAGNDLFFMYTRKIFGFFFFEPSYAPLFLFCLFFFLAFTWLFDTSVAQTFRMFLNERGSSLTILSNCLRRRSILDPPFFRTWHSWNDCGFPSFLFFAAV